MANQTMPCIIEDEDEVNSYLPKLRNIVASKGVKMDEKEEVLIIMALPKMLPIR